MLIDDGIIGLTTKVADYLPEFSTDDNKSLVTVHHLLTYTIDFNISGGSKTLIGETRPEEAARRVLACPLKHAPASNYMYSNMTAFILTQLIERVTGQNFYTLVRERVFTPLGMRTATFTPAATAIANIPPTEITTDRGEVRGIVHDEFTYCTTAGTISNGAAGLFASVRDLANFIKMTAHGGMYNGKRLFSEDIVHDWTTNQFLTLLPTLTPLGWGDLNNVYLPKFHRDIVVKSGFTGCFMAADLKNKTGFVLLSNRTYPTRPENSEAFGLVKETLLDVVFG